MGGQLACELHHLYLRTSVQLERIAHLYGDPTTNLREPGIELRTRLRHLACGNLQRGL